MCGGEPPLERFVSCPARIRRPLAYVSRFESHKNALIAVYVFLSSADPWAANFVARF